MTGKIPEEAKRGQATLYKYEERELNATISEGAC